MENDCGKILRFWNCPINFIPESVVEFTRQYRYYKDFPSAPMPEYEEVPKRWILSYQYYETKLRHYQEERFKGE